MACAAFVAIAVAACDGGRAGEVVTPPVASPSQVLSDAGSAATLERLCTRPTPIPGSAPPAEGPTPPLVAETMRAVERVRGLTFTEPVAPRAETQAELVEGLSQGFDLMFPEELYGRRSLAWDTIGVIPDGVQIRDELSSYFSTSVIGYYDTLSGELVYLGSDQPSPGERVTLAHELVHALEDQRFGLDRIDSLLADCQDDAFDAALAVVEGSATFHMVAFADEELTARERRSWQSGGGGGSAPDVAPFIEMRMAWPYRAGYDFVDWLGSRRESALNSLLETFPITTEQILHPDRTDDAPTPVDIPDLGPALGEDWNDLDVQGVGEAWLLDMLSLRLVYPDAVSAADGWDGGIYRAWNEGDRAAVVLSTVWDSPKDAERFARALNGWIGGGEVAEVLPVEGSAVLALFATDAPALAALRAAYA